MALGGRSHIVERPIFPPAKLPMQMQVACTRLPVGGNPINVSLCER